MNCVVNNNFRSPHAFLRGADVPSSIRSYVQGRWSFIYDGHRRQLSVQSKMNNFGYCPWDERGSPIKTRVSYFASVALCVRGTDHVVGDCGVRVPVLIATCWSGHTFDDGLPQFIGVIAVNYQIENENSRQVNLRHASFSASCDFALELCNWES